MSKFLKPGQRAPRSGQYQITGPRGGKGAERTVTRGDRLVLAVDEESKVVRPEPMDADPILVGDYDLHIDHPYVDDLGEDSREVDREVDLLSSGARRSQAGCHKERNGTSSEIDHR